MCEVEHRWGKPFLACKVLAAARRRGSRAEIRAEFEFADRKIKPADTCISGMYLRYTDRVRGDSRMVREIRA
jgi:hypothetical protein